ncbi:MAG: kelch repeat-containing protein [Myxococcota bacterium]
MNDLRKYNGTGGWTAICPGQGCTTQPSARAGVSMACDDANDALIVFGGEVASGGDCGTGSRYCGDTWRYSNGNWQKVVVADPEGDGNPAPRSFHAMTWDASRGAILLHGGRRYLSDSQGDCGDGSIAQGVTCLYGDLWEWTGGSWARVNTVESDSQGDPGRRAEHGLVYVPGRKETLLHGGFVLADSGIHTWYWQSGFDGRPRHIFQVELSAAQAQNATITDVEVNWDAGGIAATGNCSALPGAELLMLQAGNWSKVDENSAQTGSPATMS